ncbi:class I SAM-dependent methyltransferase [Actinomadura darangshiensis]|uniref:Class I SAM-dependent methyltransferase n=1 Tax=Actinomadura darangshiensis TaxID=705336 RepID=A0A4R5ANB8_9ACTN|nr:class I SAM-dependent methyltransferase [Actinomadura darangshiensis]TDD72524.1 class I SAM-dependent methyltransferase [Actinomadura darangshiensis]
MTDDYWNHNTHYHGVVLRNVPRGCGAALDVGCGDGLLVRRLAPRAAHVTGLDRSAEMVATAERLSEGVDNVGFVEAGLLEYDPPENHYDFVCSVAAIHHMDFVKGMTAMRDALRPGGSLVVMSLANNKGLRDWAFSGLGVPAHRVHRLRNLRRAGSPDAPIADPDMTWGEVRDEALRLLPGAAFRRHLLWRYSIVWRKPR